MIKFTALRWKNFMSYGNQFTEIDFLKYPMTLISGKNGAGKSAVIEALIYSIFGVPYRNINKPNLVNSINKKDCLVEVEFSIGKKQYKVRRGIKPVIFEIIVDGVLLNQNSTSKDYQEYLENNILHLNYKSFTQLVVLGSSSFVPFMELTAQERRDVIEELLDIRIFSKMNILLKEKISLNKEQLKSKEKEIDIINEKINLQKSHIQKINSNNINFIQSYKNEYDNTTNELKIHETELAKINTDIKILEDTIKNIKVVEQQIDVQDEQLVKIQDSILNYTNKLKFYKDHSRCSSCDQHIPEDTRIKNINYINDILSKLMHIKANVINQIDKLNNSIQNKNKIKSVYDKKIIEKQNKQISINTCNQYLNKLKKDIDLSSATSSSSSINDEQQLQSFIDEHNVKLKDKDTLLENKLYYETCYHLLKDDGIKSKIIKQYLPHMNKLINKYLSGMDFFVNFNLDETFNEIIKSRYRDEFQYNSFSEGEKFRINMALLLCWRDISRKKNSTNTNILILDEVFDSSLDVSGTEEFMKLLTQLSKKNSIFVISHKPDIISDKFSNHLKVEKKNNFSVIK